MPFDITSQPVWVLIDGHDSEGRLIFADNQLSAIIVRPDGVRPDGEAHVPKHKGRWHLEAGFGKCDARIAPTTFRTPQEAEARVKQRLARSL